MEDDARDAIIMHDVRSRSQKSRQGRCQGQASVEKENLGNPSKAVGRMGRAGMFGWYKNGGGRGV